MDELRLGAADAGQDRGYAGVGHQEAHRAGRAQLIEEPARQYIESEHRSDAGLEENSVQDLAADRDSGGAGDAGLAAARVHDRDVECSPTEVNCYLDSVVGCLADDGGGWLGKERYVLEAGAAGGILEPSEGFAVGGLAIVRIRAGEDDRMAEHDSCDGFVRFLVGFRFQAFEHDADERANTEIGGPAVGAVETELRKLVLHA